MEEQTLDIEAVSGATVSSKCILSISGVYDKLYDDIAEIGKFDVEKYRQFIKYVAIYDEESLEVVWNINDPMQLPQ